MKIIKFSLRLRMNILLLFLTFFSLPFVYSENYTNQSSKMEIMDSGVFSEVLYDNLQDSPFLLYDKFLKDIGNIKIKLSKYNLDQNYAEFLEKNAKEYYADNETALLIDALVNLEKLNESIRIILDLDGFINQFNSYNISTKKLDDLKLQVLYLFEESDFDDISILYGEAVSYVKERESVIVRYNEIKLKTDFNLVTEEKIFVTINESMYGFNFYYFRGDFENSGLLLDEIEHSLLMYESGRLVNSKNSFSIVNFFKMYFVQILSFSAFLLTLLIVFKKQLNKNFAKYNLSKYKNTKKQLTEKLKLLQKEYYVLKQISEKSYILRRNAIEKKIAEFTIKEAVAEYEINANKAKI